MHTQNTLGVFEASARHVAKIASMQLLTIQLYWLTGCRIYNYCQQKHPKTKVMAAGIRSKEGESQKVCINDLDKVQLACLHFKDIARHTCA